MIPAAYSSLFSFDRILLVFHYPLAHLPVITFFCLGNDLAFILVLILPASSGAFIAQCTLGLYRCTEYYSIQSTLRSEIYITA